MCVSIIVSVVVVDVVAVVITVDDIIVAVYAVVTDEFVMKNLAIVKE